MLGYRPSCSQPFVFNAFELPISRAAVALTHPVVQVGIDDALVMETKEEIFELNNGCVCCTGQH